MVALVAAPFRRDLTPAGPALALVLAVLVAAVLGGRRPAAVIAVLATIVTNVVFTPPFGSLKVELAADGVALGALLVLGIVVGTLVASLVERSTEAQRRLDELEFVNQQLADLGAERERLAIEAARAAALEEVDQQRRALLRSVSHDLRTPLATIRAVASDLRDGASYDETTQDELLELVGDEAERLDRLVANLLSMSRIEAGAFTPDQQVVDLGELVAGRVRRLARLLRGVHVQASYPDEPALVRGDHTQLEQVVTNLLENAARHAPDGSNLRVTVAVVGDDVVLRVADEGPGVAEHDRERIFLPFQLGEGSSSSGIGLAICKAVVEAHDGHIDVTRTPGGGATFRVGLPALAEPTRIEG